MRNNEIKPKNAPKIVGRLLAVVFTTASLCTLFTGNTYTENTEENRTNTPYDYTAYYLPTTLYSVYSAWQDDTTYYETRSIETPKSIYQTANYAELDGAWESEYFASYTSYYDDGIEVYFTLSGQSVEFVHDANYPSLSIEFREEWVPFDTLYEYMTYPAMVTELGRYDFESSLTLVKDGISETYIDDGLIGNTINAATPFISPSGDFSQFLQRNTQEIVVNGNTRDYVYVRYFSCRVYGGDTDTILYVNHNIATEYATTYSDYIQAVNSINRNQIIYEEEPFALLLSPINAFLNMEIFPTFKVAYLFYIGVGVILVGLFMKLFLGG